MKEGKLKEQNQEGMIEAKIQGYTKVSKSIKNLAPYLLFLIPAQRITIITLYDFPQLLEEPMIETFNINALNVLTLYTVASIAGLFTNLAAPALQGLFGVGKLNLVLQVLILLSALLCVFGAYNNTFFYLYLSRFIYGICQDGSYIGVNTMMERYFSGSWLTLALGLSRVYIRVFQMASTYLIPLVYIETKSLVYVFWFYGAYGVMGILLGIWFLKFENSVQKKGIHQGEDEREIINKEKLNEEQNEDGLESPDNELDSTVASNFGVKHLKHVPLISWLLIANCFLYTFVYYQFCSFMTDFISKRYTKTYLESKNIVTLIPFLSITGIPVCLFIIKRYGRKITLLIAGALFKLGSTGIFCLLPEDASYLQLLPPIMLLGASGSICSCCGVATLLQSLPTQSVPIMMAIENLATNVACLIAPTVFGIINKPRTPGAYQISNYIFLGFSLAFCVSSILAGVIEYRSSGVLDLPGDDRRCELHKQKLEADLERILRKEKGKSPQRSSHSDENRDEYELQKLD